MIILFMGLYKPPFLNEKSFLYLLSNTYNVFCSTYKNIALIRDLKMKIGKKKLHDFCKMNKCEHLIL